MFFSGNQQRIQLPRVKQFAFALNNIVVDNYGTYSIHVVTESGNISQEALITFGNGTIQGNINAPRISVYNTGEPFSISGVFFNDPNSQSMFNTLLVYANGVPYTTFGFLPQSLSNINIQTPSSGSLKADVRIQSDTVLYTFTFPPSFQIDSTVTGSGVCSHDTFVFGEDLTFYNSVESLLSGDPFIAYFEANTPLPIKLIDNDTSSQNNQIEFNLSLHTTSGDVNSFHSIGRTGLYENTITQLVNPNSNNSIATLFGGTWTGSNQFIYSDTPQSLTMSYGVFKSDSLGQPQNETIIYSFTGVSPTNGQTFTSEYVTGFSLTNSGQYTIPPIALTTGYYYVTGLQQALISMLFSSGCTGNIGVTFSGSTRFGTGASGTLNLRSVNFQNIYGVGNNSFYVVDSFSMLSGGTGYGAAPRAILQTGVYANCYDVVGRSGVNVAWFLPFSTSGGLNPSAAYLTGEVLTTTGLVSGGLTGYIVTGYNLTNPGSGYNNIFYRPHLRFQRDPSDSLTGSTSGNASGILNVKLTGLYNFNNIWKIETGFAGYSLTPTTFTGSINLPINQNYVSFRVTCSGLDNTVPVITSLSITTSAGSGITQLITGYKTYNTDTGYLKKKLNITGTFTPGSDLSFFLTQSDLDNFYSSEGYTNNAWGIDLGDLDF